MKVGTNRFTILVTDLTGTEIPGLSGSDFGLTAQIGADQYTSIDDFDATISDGIYNVSLEIQNPGQGHVKIFATDPNTIVTPDYFSVDVTQNNIDDVYRVTNFRFVDIGIQSSDQTFRTIRITSKEGDDILFTAVTQEDITDFTDWKSTFVLSASEPPSGSNLIGDAEIVNVDEPSGTIDVKIPFALTDDIVPVGSSEIRIFGDIQARTPSGDRRTIADVIVRLRRQYTLG